MTIKIYIPSKTAMQSGKGKTKKWLAEYISDEIQVKDNLMGWNSSFDTKSQIKLFFESTFEIIFFINFPMSAFNQQING